MKYGTSPENLLAGRVFYGQPAPDAFLLCVDREDYFLFRAKHSTGTWSNFAVVLKRGGQRKKWYVFGFNGDRISQNHDVAKLERRYPDIFKLVLEDLLKAYRGSGL